MWLDVADNHVATFVLVPASRFQHGVSLPDPGGIAEEDFKRAAARVGFVGLDSGQQFVGIRSGQTHGFTMGSSNKRATISRRSHDMALGSAMQFLCVAMVHASAECLVNHY